MKIRIVAVLFGALALVGVGAAPEAAASPCLPPVIYPFCG